MVNNKYVHGYSERESERLFDQADNLSEFLHNDTKYPPESKVLEAGCGVGAQTVILAKNSPYAHFTSIDISEISLSKAKALIDKENIKNVTFQKGDIFNLEFEEESFDHIFVCFILEHLQDPVKALFKLKKVLKKGGSITVIEGDHGSCYFYPETKEAKDAWQCLIKVQEILRGNSLIGRELYPLLNEVKFKNIKVTPRMIYTDAGNPGLVDGFVKKIIIPMVEGIKNQALELKITDEILWNTGINDLHKTAGENGTFCYNFFKGVGIK